MGIFDTVREKLGQIQLSKSSEKPIDEFAKEQIGNLITRIGKGRYHPAALVHSMSIEKGICQINFRNNKMAREFLITHQGTLTSEILKIPGVNKVDFGTAVGTEESENQGCSSPAHGDPRAQQGKAGAAAGGSGKSGAGAGTGASAAGSKTGKVPVTGSIKNVIAVASGKGGVGKSTISQLVAQQLKAKGYKVGILDADIYGPSISHLYDNPKSVGMENEKLHPAEADGIKLVSMAMFTEASKAAILRGPMAAQVIKQFIGQVYWGELDYLIIDYPPGTGDIQLTLAQSMDISGAIMVTTAAEIALIDVRRAIAMFQNLKVPVLGIVESMSYFVCDGCEKRHAIFGEGGGKTLAKEYALSLLGQIPFAKSNHQGWLKGEGIPEHVSKAADELVTKLEDKVKILAAAAATKS